MNPPISLIDIHSYLFYFLRGSGRLIVIVLQESRVIADFAIEIQLLDKEGQERPQKQRKESYVGEATSSS